MPHIIMIEPTNSCNFQCNMCQTGRGTSKRKKQHMQQSLYTKILEQMSPSIPLKFVGQGEPLLNPETISFIQQAKSKNLLCHLTTNGSLLSPEAMSELIACKLDSIKFSFQGVDAVSYREMRGQDKFQQLISTIRLLHDKRGALPLPFITVTTSTSYESKEQIEQFKALVEPICDKIQVGETILSLIDDFSIFESQAAAALVEEKKKEMETNKRHFLFCIEAFDAITIWSDGIVSACCQDVNQVMAIGDANSETIADIWAGKKITAYRNLLAQGRYDDLPLCRSCYDYMSYTFSDRNT